MSDQLVLAIEPDLRQAAIVKRIVREKVLADVAVVDSRDAAIEAMRTCMPDVLLLSALLSPRDEDELIAHLKTLENAGHLQTHTIPQLASALQPGDERGGRGLLSAFRKKKDPGPANGCDPDLFADEIRVFLKRAQEKKHQLQDGNHAAPDMRPSATGTTKAAAPEDNLAPAPQASSWSSPFEWKPAGSSSRRAPNPEPPAAAFESPTAIPEPPAVIPQPPAASFEPPAAMAGFAAPVAAAEPAILPPVSLVVESAPSIPDPPSPIPESVIAATPARDERRGRYEAPRKRDSGFRIRDSGSAISDQGLVWLRREGGAPETADGPEDVRALLSTLAVPSAIASVSYPRGCRIRRVRVPASPDAESAEAAGAVLASRGAADHRDRRPTA